MKHSRFVAIFDHFSNLFALLIASWRLRAPEAFSSTLWEAEEGQDIEHPKCFAMFKHFS